MGWREIVDNAVSLTKYTPARAPFEARDRLVNLLSSTTIPEVVEPYPRSQITGEVGPPIRSGEGPGFLSSLGRDFAEIGANTATNASRGLADLGAGLIKSQQYNPLEMGRHYLFDAIAPETEQKIQDYVSPQSLAESLASFKESIVPRPQGLEAIKRHPVLAPIESAVLGAGPAVMEYGLAGPMGPLSMAGVDALKAYGSGASPEEILTAAGTGAVNQAFMHGLAPYSQPVRVAGLGALGYGQSALSGGTPIENLTNAVTLGALGAGGPAEGVPVRDVLSESVRPAFEWMRGLKPVAERMLADQTGAVQIPPRTVPDPIIKTEAELANKANLTDDELAQFVTDNQRDGVRYREIAQKVNDGELSHDEAAVELKRAVAGRYTMDMPGKTPEEQAQVLDQTLEGNKAPIEKSIVQPGEGQEITSTETPPGTIPINRSPYTLNVEKKLDNFPETKKAVEDDLSKATPSLNPQIVILGGLPGSGKSSGPAGELKKAANTIVVDPDEIKYDVAIRRGLGNTKDEVKDYVNHHPEQFHEESAIAGKALVRKAIEQGKNIVYDVTMNGRENITDVLDLADQSGYLKHLRFMSIPYEEAFARNYKRRHFDNGRGVQTSTFEKEFSDMGPHRNVLDLKNRFDSVELYDNHVPFGDQPKLILKEERNNRIAGDDNLLERFKTLAYNKMAEEGKQNAREKAPGRAAEIKAAEDARRLGSVQGELGPERTRSSGDQGVPERGQGIPGGVETPPRKEEVANPPPGGFSNGGEPPSFDPKEVLKEAERITGPVKKEPTGLFRKAQKAKDVVQTLLTSEFTPLRRLEKDVNRTYGKRTWVQDIWEKKSDLARSFEQVAGSAGKAEADIIDFRKRVVEPIRNLSDEFNQYLFLKRTESRLTADPTMKRVGDWTVEKARVGLEGLRQKVGDKDFGLLERQGKVFQSEMDRSLQLQVESGRMSQELYDQIKASNDFYAPFKVMKYVEEGESSGRGGGRNVATTQALSKKITGITSEDFQIGNILQSSAEQIYRSRILAEKNLKMMELAKLSEVDTEGKFIKKMTIDPSPVIERVEKSLDRIDENISKRDQLVSEISGLKEQLKSAKGERAPNRQQAREGAQKEIQIEVGKSKVETKLPRPPGPMKGKMQTPQEQAYWKQEIENVRKAIASEKQVPAEHHPFLSELKGLVEERLQEPDLLAEVKKRGGLSIDKETTLKGELGELSVKETGRRGILAKDGLPVDTMRLGLVDAGVIPTETTNSELIDRIKVAAREKPEFDSQDIRLIDQVLSGKVISGERLKRLEKVMDWARNRSADYGNPEGDRLGTLQNAEKAFIKESNVPVASKRIVDRIRSLNDRLEAYQVENGEAQVKLFDEIQEMVKNKDLTIREARDYLKRINGQLASERSDKSSIQDIAGMKWAVRTSEGRLRSKKYRDLEERRSNLEEYLSKLDTGKVSIRDKTPAPAGWDKVSYLENGRPTALMIPRDVATAVRGLTPGDMGIVRKVLAQVAVPFRWGATSANAAFQVVNLLFADLPRAALVSKYGIRNPVDLVRFPLDWAYSFYTSMRGNFGKPNDLFMKWIRSGAANSTIQREISPDTFKESLGIPEKGLWGAVKRVATIPQWAILDTIAKFGNAIEETSKITGLKRGMRIEGIEKLSPEKAKERMSDIVTEVRNFSGSPDFARHGSLTKELNLVFMFLNARVQGAASDLARLGGLSGIKPAVSMWARLATAIGIPTLTLMLHNLSSDNRDDWMKVKEEERSRYWMIPRYGEDGNPLYFKDEEGANIREYWRIPKREVVQLFSNLIENSILFAKNEDPKALEKYAVDFLENISPVSIQGRNLQERAESVVSSMNPLIKAPIEYGFNRNSFFHTDTVPDRLANASPYLQYRKTTPGPYKWLGDYFSTTDPETGKKSGGISPLKLEQLVSSISAGGISQFTPGKAEEGRPSWVKWPVVKRFVRTGQVNEEDEIAAIKDAMTGQTDERVMMRNKVEDWIDDFHDVPKEQKKERLLSLVKEDENFAKKVIDRLEQKAMGLTYPETLMMQLGVEDGRRALYISKKLDEMKGDKEKIRGYLMNLAQKKILSEKILEQVAYIKTKKAKVAQAVTQ